MTGHMEGETSVGGEMRGQIKSERGGWRKEWRVSEYEEQLSLFSSLVLLIRC